MTLILSGFTLFHLAVGVASLALAVRLLSPEERGRWRSQPARWTAEALCWIYPALAFVCASLAWREAGGALAVPLMLAPILWLVAMGTVFAVVDFVEDGVIGNARARD